MSALAIPLPLPNDERTRWGIALAVALAIHGVTATALLVNWSPTSDFDSGAPVVTIELPEAPAAFATPPNDLAPGPLEAESDPTPPKKEEKPIDPESEVALPIPEPKPEQPVEEQHATAPPSITMPSAPAPPVAGAAVQPSVAIVSRWESELVAHIERFKRYPSEARAQGTQGIVRITFTIDHDGWVRSSRVVQSSGSPQLDEESLAMLTRAQPMPPPPAQMANRQLSFTVPVRFTIR
jgi:periplasmic protein TonB